MPHYVCVPYYSLPLHVEQRWCPADFCHAVCKVSHRAASVSFEISKSLSVVSLLGARCCAKKLPALECYETKRKKEKKKKKKAINIFFRCGSLEYTQKHVRRSSIATYSFNCVLQQNLNESGQALTMSEWHTRHQSEDWSVFKNNT